MSWQWIKSVMMIMMLTMSLMTLILCHMKQQYHATRHNENVMPSCINVIHDIILSFKNYLMNRQKNKNKNSLWVQRTKMWTRGEWNEWILHEWMEQMNIPWMNGTSEYSVNEWNKWIFREWIFRDWIFLVLGGPCQVQTQNVLRLLSWALWISSLFFAVSLSLFLSLWTLHAAAGNSKFCSSFQAFCDGGENQ